MSALDTAGTRAKALDQLKAYGDEVRAQVASKWFLSDAAKSGAATQFKAYDYNYALLAPTGSLGRGVLDGTTTEAFWYQVHKDTWSLLSSVAKTIGMGAWSLSNYVTELKSTSSSYAAAVSDAVPSGPAVFGFVALIVVGLIAIAVIKVT